jgi:aspartate/methionine/tyrosine aminotransferase
MVPAGDVGIGVGNILRRHGRWQVAAEGAFDCHDELGENVARYRRSRDHLLRTLPEAGFSRLSPAEGAFYLFADIADRSNDSTAFCTRMLAEVGIAATPGVDFDHARGNRFLRFSYCGGEDDIREAAARPPGVTPPQQPS